MSGDIRQRMQAALEHFRQELQTVRTGRANAALVENIMVTYHDQEMPLKSLANVNTPDGKSIIISPWDPSSARAIEKAIREEKNLGLNPTSDGKTVYVAVPPPTQERREQLVKQVGELREEAQVALRNVRHDELKGLQTRLKDKALSEDEFEQEKKRLDDLVHEYGSQADSLTEDKKQDIMAV